MYPALLPAAIGLQVTLPEGLDLARRHGFSGYHVNIHELASLGTARTEELAQEKGIRLASWGFPLEFRNDEGSYKESLAALPQLAETAAELGLFRTSTWIMPCSNELTYRQNFAFHVSRLKPAASILAEFGIRLGLEYVGPKTLWSSQRFPFVHTLKEMTELALAVGSNVGFLLDSFHLYTAHETAEEVRRLSSEQIVEVHVNDARPVPVDEQLDQLRALPGETGVIDLKAFLQAVAATGYDGPVMVEPFSQRVRELTEDDACAETASSLKRVWQQAGLQTS